MIRGSQIIQRESKVGKRMCAMSMRNEAFIGNNNLETANIKEHAGWKGSMDDRSEAVAHGTHRTNNNTAVVSIHYSR